jgi:hypothetical protein
MKKKAVVGGAMAELAIVGGGAAGLFAAAVAAERGLRCVVLERKARVGSKLLMTGNGRCNFTRDETAGQMARELGEPVGSWARTALEACPPSRIAGGFRSLGLKVRRMEDGRLFPASGKAADVVHLFGDLLRETGTPLAVNCAVEGLERRDGGGWWVKTGAFWLGARSVLVATGGMGFPKTGSVGDGQRWARELGLKTEECRAGLAGYEWEGAERRAGERWERAEGRVTAGGRVLCRWRGEVEFERWGVGGSAVYNCQRWAERNWRGKGFALELEGEGGRCVVENPVARPLKEAIVTIGGVSLGEVDPRTMEAKRLPGLYFAGEVLDVDGPTGGYNLTLAFATAWVAATSAAQRCGK